MWRLYYERVLMERTKRRWSQEKAAEICGFRIESRQHYGRLESGKFPQPCMSTITRIAKGFDLPPEDLILKAGQKPAKDLAAFFAAYKKKNQKPPIEAEQVPTQEAGTEYGLVAFDLDNVLIKGLEFSWKVVWAHLGYDDSIRLEGVKKFLRGEITYLEWCDYCYRFFRQKRLRRADFKDICEKYRLAKNARRTIKALREAGVVTGVISGGIDIFLEELIPDYRELFDFVYINKIEFLDNGLMCRIEPTDFDFQGKLKCLEHLGRKLGIPLARMCFVGEGFNDKYVATGDLGLTVAISPRSQEVAQIFDVVLADEDLSQILGYVLPQAGEP